MYMQAVMGMILQGGLVRKIYLCNDAWYLQYMQCNSSVADLQ
jgi:hypothetical protein